MLAFLKRRWVADSCHNFRDLITSSVSSSVKTATRQSNFAVAVFCSGVRSAARGLTVQLRTRDQCGCADCLERLTRCSGVLRTTVVLSDLFRRGVGSARLTLR